MLASRLPPPLQERCTSVSRLCSLCFWNPEGQSVKVVESTCDYRSRGFLKLAGPLSVFLIGCLAHLGVPPMVPMVPGTPRRSDCPAPGAGGWGWDRGRHCWGAEGEAEVWWHKRSQVLQRARGSCVSRRVCACVHTPVSVKAWRLGIHTGLVTIDFFFSSRFRLLSSLWAGGQGDAKRWR